MSYEAEKVQQVSALNSRLKDEGFSCWLDANETCGKEPLARTSERALRAADVVVCCVTERFTVSATCRREVQLADTLGKPVALLMLEAINWPSPGPIGMTLANTPYIQCSDASVQRDWNAVQFKALLTEIERLHTEAQAGANNGVTQEAQVSEFDAKRKWTKLRNVGRAAAQLQKGATKSNPKSSTCALM